MKKFKILIAILIIPCIVLLAACDGGKQSGLKNLTGISITSQPDRKEYFAGEEFNAAGMVVSAQYKDGTSETVSDYILDKTVLAAGDTSVTVSFTKDNITKTAVVNGITVDGTAVGYLEDLLNSMLIQIGAQAPSYVSALFDDTTDKLLKAISDAGITGSDLIKLIRLYEEILTDISEFKYPDYPDYEIYNAARRAAYEIYYVACEAAYEIYEDARETAWEIYEDARETAWEAYIAYASYEDYLAALEAAQGTYEAACKAAYEICEAALEAAQGTYEAACEAADEIYEIELDAYNIAIQEYSTELSNYIFEAIEKFYNTGITNTKISTFIWEIISTFREMADELIADIAESGVIIPAQVYDVLGIYDDILVLGKTEFVKVFKAFLDLAKLNVGSSIFDMFLPIYSQSGSSSSTVPTVPTKNEFRDIMLALKSDILENFEILGVEEMAAICNLFKTFAPYTASYQFSDEYYLDRISWYEKDIINYGNKILEINAYIEELNGYISELQGEISEYEGYSNPEYYQDLIDYLQGQINQYNYVIQNAQHEIDWYEQDIDYYQNEIDRLNGLIGTGASDDIYDIVEEALDSFTGYYALIRTSLIASLNSIDTTMINAFYEAMNAGNMNTIAVVFGKIINAGLNAVGGITAESSKEAVRQYIGYLLSINDLVGGELELPANFDDIIGQLYNDAATLAVKSYTAVLDTSFNDNLIIQLVNSIFRSGTTKGQPELGIDVAA